MAKAEATFNGKRGVWRTVGGRRIFIATGQSLEDAMKSSGKFNNIISSKKYVDENGTDDNSNKQRELKSTLAKVESYKEDYKKYREESEKYSDLASKAQYGSDEYKKYSEKRSEASKNMQEAKVNALTEFNKTIPYDEMFDVVKKISGLKNVQFEEPKLVNRDGRTLYTKY